MKNIEKVSKFINAGNMATFSIEADRVGNNTKVKLTIHGNKVVAETKELPIMDKTYTELFEYCKNFINSRSK